MRRMARRKQHLGEGAAQALTAADAVEVASGGRRRTPAEPVRLVQLPAETQREAPVTTNIRTSKRHAYAVQDEALRRVRRKGNGRPNHSEIYDEAVELWTRAMDALKEGRGLAREELEALLPEVLR